VAEQFKADFNLDFYTDKTSREEIHQHVGAFLGEKLLSPRSQDLWIGRDGLLDPDYIAMMERSIQYWSDRGDTAAVNRFQSELAGMRNLAYIVIESGENGVKMPIVAIASDPGSFYVDAEGNKKSVTFVGVLDKSEINGWKYKIFSLPTKYIGLEKHKELLWRVGDIAQTKQILGSSLEELTAENLVAFPVILNEFIVSLDSLANSLGYESWDEIEKFAADQFALENDIFAKGRREVMISQYSELIYDLIRSDGSINQKEALVNAMSEMFALEQGKEYLGWNNNQILSEIQKNTRLALAHKLGAMDNQAAFESFSITYDLGDWQENVTQYLWMRNAFQNNSTAREALSTGCGGSGNNYQNGFGIDSFSFGYEQPIYSGFDVVNGYMTNTSEDKSWSYTETGTCAGCGKHSSEVGLLGPCKICPKCVAEIESQAV
jgi:hypothetical protein